jgi:FtsP/CotA-like multicopper oxidase with cupredoxin domain
MTTGIGPYVVPPVVNTSTVAGIVETTLTLRMAMVNIGGVTMMAHTFDGAIPGPTFRLNVGNTVIVRLINELDHPAGIHWHGIELENAADGTPFTQDGVLPRSGATPLPGHATYLYKFKVSRPGIYWYHPHHHMSTNQVFKGLYGMIIVADTHEAALIGANVLPPVANTLQLVLSDVTVCKAVGSNDLQTYPSATTLPWVGNTATIPPGGAPTPVQTGSTPRMLCEIPPSGSALDDDGNARTSSFGSGDIPNIQPMTETPATHTNEGQTVLTNGMNVGGRGGSPMAPGTLATGASVYGAPLRPVDLRPGEGLRLQIVNSATVRYFRLILTGTDGGTVAQRPLVRVGGEGELLDNALVEGNVTSPPTAGTFDFKYSSGEILLPPGSRADVVVALPSTASGVWTLWTQDYPRTGGGFSNIPTVPVMHLNVSGTALVPAYTIINGTPVLANPATGGASVPVLGTPIATPLLDPSAFSPSKIGNPSPTMVITASGGVANFDGVAGPMTETIPYYNTPHIGDTMVPPHKSSRFAAVGIGNVLELRVQNSTGGHHPFHLHGFSMQPLDLTKTGSPTYTFPHEFRDNIDIPAGYTLRFRIQITDRPLADGMTMGGAFGRWMFHCHIFFHHHAGMMSELVTCASGGHEKPNVNVVGSWEYASIPGMARRHGTFAADPFSPAVTVTGLLAHLEGSTTPFGTLTPTGPGTSSGTWTWELNTTGMTPSTQYVYITATDSDTRKDQAVFRLQIGGIESGSDTGDPHIATVDGKYYDFQSVGEFTLLRDVEYGLEIQVRQTPVPTATPVEDAYSGLTACVSINTAVAARVGGHRISYQPHPASMQRLQTFLDGKLAELSAKGIDLGADRVSSYAVDGATAMRVDFANGTVLTVTPWFWGSNNVWLLNLEVSNPSADTGIMGSIPRGTWLPALPNGATVGPKPDSLHERFVALYQTFADAWRVTDSTSLFVYAPGTSTETFTDVDWPAEKFPCRVKPQFQIPGAQPSLANIDVATAERICRPVTVDDLHRNCVFDVATTGDEALVKSYILAQDLRLKGATVQIYGDKNPSRAGESVILTVNVSGMGKGRPTPSGSVTFLIDGVAAGPPVRLDNRGQASFNTNSLGVGEHKIRAVYEPGGAYGCLLWTWLILILKMLGLARPIGKGGFSSCSSPNLLHTVV